MELYLTTLWKEGKLAGSKTGDAFVINIGVSSMTANEIQLGKLIAVINVAFAAPDGFENISVGKAIVKCAFTKSSNSMIKLFACWLPRIIFWQAPVSY